MHTHRQLCKIAARWLLDQSRIDLVTWELKYQRGVYDVMGLTSKPRAQEKKLVAIEVKRTRADLLQDLRKKKMLKYERRATHCYLAATSEALRTDKFSNRELLKDLKTKGLPIHWGVLLLPTSGTSVPKVIRGARRHKTVRQQTLRTLTRRIARSFMYRVLSDTSPMVEHNVDSTEELHS